MYKNQLSIILVAAIILACFADSASPLQKVPKNNNGCLIEIGPADWVPMNLPLKWSPTGGMLSYFNDDFLMISDSLGNAYQVDSIDLIPFRYEWLSDDQIIVNLHALYGKIDTMKMVTIDVNSGEQIALAGDADDIYSKGAPIDSNFIGPFLTVSGNAYYLMEIGDLTEVVIPPSDYRIADGSDALAENQILRYGEGGLYLEKADGSDSTRIGPPGLPNSNSFLLSPDKAYLFMDGVIIKLADSSRILLDTIIEDVPPEIDGCGILYPSFNIARHEITFQVGCDNDNVWLDNRIGIFDYASGKLTMLDSLTGLSNCTSPAFSPDGRKIAFLSDEKAYIYYRPIE